MRPDDLLPEAPGKTLTKAVLMVGFNRRLYIWLAVIGATLSPIFFVLAIAYRINSGDPMMNAYHINSGIFMLYLSVAATTLSAISVLGLKRATMFTYDGSAKTVEARDRLWGRLRTYPRRERGYERLEYSVHFARLYEVRPDGHRHEVFVRWWWADRRAWTAFVDRFLQDHEPNEQAAAAVLDDETDGPPYRRRL